SASFAHGCVSSTPSDASTPASDVMRRMGVGGDTQPAESQRAMLVPGKKLLVRTPVEIGNVATSPSCSTRIGVARVVRPKPGSAGRYLPAAVNGIAGSPPEG